MTTAMSQVETYMNGDHAMSVNNDYHSGDSVSGAKSPLSSFAFLKNLGGDKKTKGLLLHHSNPFLCPLPDCRSRRPTSKT